jgi:iron complex outermembrane receptor protein
MGIWSTKSMLASGAAIVCVMSAAPAMAQQRTFDIPSQSAAKAIPEFARQAGVQIIAAGGKLRGKRTSAVKGQLDVRAALQILIAGTGLRIATDNGVTIALTDGNESITAANQQSVSGEAQAGSAAVDDGSAQDIVVTGSRLRGVPPASPVITITQQDILDSGHSSAGEVIRSLPQNFNGGQNPGILGAGGGSTNATGASTANLRGLGSTATLTLINGHRLAIDGFAAGADISAIPLAAVEQIDVLTDGASAIYGSDAIAGVINFRMKRDFDGAEIRARAGLSTEGGGAQQQVGALIGNTWGTGHVMANIEHSQTGSVRAEQRDYLTGVFPGTEVLPYLRSTSVFVSGEQQLVGALSIFADGLYSKSYWRQDQTDPTFTQQSVARSERYTGTAGFDWTLSPDWSATVFGTVARDNTPFTSALAFPPGPLPTPTGNYYDNKLRLVEFSTTGPLLRLPSGPVKVALGGGLRHESYQFTVPTNAATNRAGNREIKYFFGEAQIPVLSPDAARPFLNRLDITGAARYEHYSDFGSTFNPKIGVVLQVAPPLTLRASWGTSFHAPTFNQLIGVRQVRVERLPTPTGTGRRLALSVIGADPNLSPEKATTLTINAVFEPKKLPGFSASITYFRIHFTDRIVNPFLSVAEGVSNLPLFSPYITVSPVDALQAQIVATADAGFFRNTSGLPYVTSDVGYILYRGFTNAASRTARGLDVDLKYRLGLSASTEITPFLNLSLLSEREQLVPGSSNREVSGLVFYPPSTRARGGGTLRSGDLATTIAVNYIGGSRNNVSTTQSRVASWTTVDASVAYEFPQSGSLPGLRLAISGQNLLNRQPPFVAPNSTTFRGINYDSTNASPLGRYVSVDASVRF